jgi:pantetheine-phosphate adenylyltransferase
MPQRVLYPGSFDPFTNGHAALIQRALEIFPAITLLVAVSGSKDPLFTLEERLAMLQEVYAHDTRITVESWDGLLATYARKHHYTVLLRGLRPTGDFDYEFQMAAMNKTLNASLETVFLMAQGPYYMISSSAVREVWQHGGAVEELVPPTVLHYMQQHRPQMK